jgi:hypothetical protein
VEPNGDRGRHNDMFADTDAIRALGAANSAQAADLAAVAAALSSIPHAVDALSPVGAHFLAALSAAAMDASREVAALGERVADGGRIAHASAAAYDYADERTGTLVARVY